MNIAFILPKIRVKLENVNNRCIVHLKYLAAMSKPPDCNIRSWIAIKSLNRNIIKYWSDVIFICNEIQVDITEMAECTREGCTDSLLTTALTSILYVVFE